MAKDKAAMSTSALNEEAKKAASILKGKVVSNVWRHRPTELGIEFADGSRLFVDMQGDGLELSITEQ